MRLWLTILFLCCCGILSAQTYHIGDLYTAPDGSKGIVYYIHPDGSGGWVVALTDASDGCAWGAATDVPGLTNQNPSYYQNLLNDTAGYANTLTLRAYQNNNTTYAAGKVDFAHGWVLPSPAQLRVLYGQLPFIATAIANARGTALAYDWYWCSAERDASNAWRVNFGSGDYSGYFNYTSKSTSCRVRAVRSFSLTSVVYDTALTYQWNTGSTHPYVNVNPSQTTNYQVTATTDYGCSTTAEQTILVGTGSAQTIYDTVCQGASYEANGFSITEGETQTAGTLTRTRTMTTSGCSSNLTLQLRVNEPVASTCSATACEHYEWNGVTYYESGDYTQTFTAANGCDSVVTLQLTINHGTHNVVTVDTCDSYTWHGTTYTSSGTYMYDYSNYSDCLSTDTLQLTIHHATHNVVRVDTCDSYTWHGTTYTTSGTYHYDYTNASGCSSTDTLHLNIRYSTHNVVMVDTCDSYEWNGQVYTESGEYTQTFTAANGCDSVVTLHLTIDSMPNVTVIATDDIICEGSEVTLHATATGTTPITYLQPIAIGDILCTDNSIVKPSDWPVTGKTAQGVVFFVDNTGEHGWAVHLNEQQINLRWATIRVDIPGLVNYSTPRSALTDFNGYENTQIIRSAGTAAEYPVAYAVDFENGWYLPALGQATILLTEINDINPTLQMLGGTLFPRTTYCVYHTSTEYNNLDAWNAGSNGNNMNHNKAFLWNPNFRIRSVRSF